MMSQVKKLLPKKINKITIYLMILFIIALGGITLKGTYAKFTSSYTTPDNIVGMSLSFALNIDNIEEYEEINISPNSYELFNVKVTNSSNSTAYYGIWYKMVNPTTKTSDITIARSVENSTATSGSISSNNSITTTIIIKNNTSNSVKVNVGVASSTTSTSAIEYLNGKSLISGTTAEADYVYDSANDKYIGYNGNSSFTNSKTLYSYTGSIQTFTASRKGIYKLEAWGAQGGTNGSYIGGYGGYAKGGISLDTNQKIYITVGSQGGSNSSITNVGGYGGGGYSGNNNAAQSYGGGGASYVTTTNATLVSIGSSNLDKILIVAGGGGGATSGSTTRGGDGGGYIGNDGTSSSTTFNTSTYIPKGGTQTGAGYAYQGTTRQGLFGTGITSNTSGYGGGGGGGLWGGSNGHGTTGSGGSGYIGNSLLKSKAMYCYNCQTSQDSSTLTYTTSTTSATPTANTAKTGNGAVAISIATPVPEIKQPINVGEQLENNQITCTDNGGGCRVYKIQDTTELGVGTHQIKIIVQDDLGQTYKYTLSLTVSNKTSQSFKVVYDTTKLYLYNDSGTLLNSVDSGTVKVRNVDRTTNFIGKSNWTADKYFQGYIYKLKITLQNGTTVLNYDFTKNTIKDLSGNGYDGILQNGASLKYDGKRYALFLDGVDDYLQVPTIPSTANFASGYTIEVEAIWEATNHYARIMDFGNGPRSDNILIANHTGGTTGLLSHYYDGTNVRQVLYENFIKLHGVD